MTRTVAVILHNYACYALAWMLSPTFRYHQRETYFQAVRKYGQEEADKRHPRLRYFTGKCYSVDPETGVKCTRKGHATDDHAHADGGGTVTALWGSDFHPYPVTAVRGES